MGEIIQFPLGIVRTKEKTPNYAVRTPALSMDIAAIADLKEEDFESGCSGALLAQLAVRSSDPVVIARVRNVHAVIGAEFGGAAGPIDRKVMAAAGADPDSPEVLALLRACRAASRREMRGDEVAGMALVALLMAVAREQSRNACDLVLAVGKK